MKFELLDSNSVFGCDESYFNNLNSNGIKVTKEKVHYPGIPDDECDDIATIIEINSLEEIMKVIDIVKNRIVVSNDSITIYDGYLE